MFKDYTYQILQEIIILSFIQFEKFNYQYLSITDALLTKTTELQHNFQF